jgi:hypothetical protein
VLANTHVTLWTIKKWLSEIGFVNFILLSLHVQRDYNSVTPHERLDVAEA